MALINTRPVGSDLMKQVMNACCCDKSLRNQVHLPVGLIDGCSSTAEKPLVRVSSMIYPRSSSRWPISLWRWNIWEFNEISFSDGRSLNAVRCVCRVQGKVLGRKLAKCPQVAPSFDVFRVVCDGTTSTDPKVDGAVRDPPVSLADESTGGAHDDVQSFLLIGKFPESMNCDLHKFDDISSRKHSDLVDARRLQNTNDARGRGEAKKKKTNPADRCRTDRPIFSRRTNQEACSGVKKEKVQKIRRK